VHDCEVTGVPPVQPVGDEVSTVRVWVLFDWQVPQAEYVNDVQVGAGGTYVHDCEVTGVPVHPEGPEVRTVRVWVPLGWQAPQAEYVYWQAAGPGGT
jgi:hypothetical protein